MIISISTTLAILHGDDEDYGNANVNTRSRSIYLGNDMWIPMRQDFFTWIAKSLPEEMYLNYTDSANVDTTNIRKTLSDQLKTALFFPAIPQFIKPVSEVFFNKNLFTGRAIESQNMEDLATEDRWTASTSPLAILMSRAGAGVIGDAMFSPVQIDHFVRGFFGLTGASIMVFSRELAKNPGFVESARAMGADLDLIPDVDSDRLALKLPGNQHFGKGEKGNTAKTLMYEVLAWADEGNERVRKLSENYRQRDMTDPDVRAEYDSKQEALEEKYKGALGPRFKHIRASLNKLRERKNKIQRNRTWSPAQKARRYKEVDDTETKMLERLVPLKIREEIGFDEWRWWWQ
jgi:hypothetical protein